MNPVAPSGTTRCQKQVITPKWTAEYKMSYIFDQNCIKMYAEGEQLDYAEIQNQLYQRSTFVGDILLPNFLQCFMVFTLKKIKAEADDIEKFGAMVSRP